MSPNIQEKTEEIRAGLRRLAIDGVPYFVAEGDLLISEQEFPTYAEQRLTRNPPAALDVNVDGRTAKLIAVGDNGKPVRWAPGVVLTYHVRKETFPKQDQYTLARASLVKATEEWMANCGVEFRHIPEQDDNSALRGQSTTVFYAQYYDAGGEFIAAAFFPNDPPSRRMVLIDPSFFADNLLFNRVGVFRHELGHTLGFRHEQISSGAPPSCPKEVRDGAIDLTVYDPRSVMHYFCGGVGSKDLKITDIDRAGAQKLYGPPVSGFRLVRP
jgi:matrixin